MPTGQVFGHAMNAEKNIQPNACAQEALQTPALAQVWVVWSKQPET